MNIKIKRTVLKLIIVLLLILIIKVLFFSNFLSLIRMKSYIKKINKTQLAEQTSGKICDIYSEDKKRGIQINIPNKFDYSTGALLSNKGIEAIIVINKNQYLASEINNSTFGNSFIDLKTDFFTYNNRNSAIIFKSIWNSIISYNSFRFDIIIPIDLQYYCQISFNSYAFRENSFKKEDIEALLNFKVIK